MKGFATNGLFLHFLFVDFLEYNYGLFEKTLNLVRFSFLKCELSGRVLDLRPRGCGFEPHRRHWVVVLEQDTFILA